MTPASRQYTAFHTNREIYQWKIAPMGLAGMSGSWSRHMERIFSGIPFLLNKGFNGNTISANLLIILL